MEVEKGVTLDRTTENIFIKSNWSTVRPHLRLALGYRHNLEPTFRYVILTDERIVNVYVGNERYGSRSKKNRDEQDNFNGLKDLVESPNLVVIRLGFLGWKNVAAPGSLKQSLMLREAARRPTWVVMNPEGEYPISWNEEVAAYIAEHFEVVELKRTGPDLPPSMSVEVEEPRPKRRTREAQAPESEAPSLPSLDDGMDMVGESNRPRKGSNYKKRRNDSGGEGPV